MSAPRNPDHDQHAAGLYRATALRFHARYVSTLLSKHPSHRGSRAGALCTKHRSRGHRPR